MQSLDRSFADLAVWHTKLSDLRHHASMGDRYRTPDGWAVEVVGLSATPDRNDGERLKVTYCGFFVAVVRTVAELEQWFALSDLEPDTLISAPQMHRLGWLGTPKLWEVLPRPELDSARCSQSSNRPAVAEVGNVGPS